MISVGVATRTGPVPDAISAGGTYGDLALHVLEQGGDARLIVDLNARLVWSSSKFHQLCASLRDFRVVAGALSFTGDPVRHEFAAFLARCRREGGSAELFKGASADEHLLVRGTCLPQTIDGDLFALTLTVVSQPRERRFVGLKRVFGLTDAEQRVLLHLLNGRTAEEAADAAALSVETVRTHIRRIYAKVGVKSRERLFHLMMSFCA